jgi:hypothetical protein
MVVLYMAAGLNKKGVAQHNSPRFYYAQRFKLFWAIALMEIAQNAI